MFDPSKNISGSRGSQNTSSDTSFPNTSTPVSTSSAKRQRQVSPDALPKRHVSAQQSNIRTVINFNKSGSEKSLAELKNEVHYLGVSNHTGEKLELNSHGSQLKAVTVDGTNEDLENINLPEGAEAYYLHNKGEPNEIRPKIATTHKVGVNNITGTIKGHSYHSILSTKTAEVELNDEHPYIMEDGRETGTIACIVLSFKDLIARQEHDEEKRTNPNIAKFSKTRKAEIGTKELLQKNIKYELKDIADQALNASKEKYEVEHSEWGSCFGDMFKEMEKDQPSEAQYKYIMISSGNHMISARLALKPRADSGINSNEKKYDYVLNIYDPNSTLIHGRIIVDNTENNSNLLTEFKGSNLEDLNKIKNWKMNDFVYKPENYFGKKKNPNREAVSLFTVLDNNTYKSIKGEGMIIDSPGEKRIVSYMSDNAEARKNPARFYIRFKAGLSLDALKEELKNCETSEDRLKLLAAKRSDGGPGLSRAMFNGHSNTVKEFGGILFEQGELQKPQIKELLMGKQRTNGVRDTTAFEVGILKNQTECIKEFSEIVLEAERKGLLDASEVKELLLIDKSDSFEQRVQQGKMEQDTFDALKVIWEKAKNNMGMEMDVP